MEPSAEHQQEDPTLVDNFGGASLPVQDPATDGGNGGSASEDLAPVRQKKFPKHLMEIYDVQGLIGRGGFSTVWRCVHRATGQVRAVKKIDTSELSPREVAKEVAVMRLLRHVNVVRCYDVFLEAQFVNVVVDMFAGGDLIDGLNVHRKQRGRISDPQMAHIAKQMLSAVAHIHSLQIVHRDVKGENFLADQSDIGDPACNIALADFGTAKRLEPGKTLAEKVGTPAFWAPEIWDGAYDTGVDVWAVGITAFILLTGSLPFQGEDQIRKPIEKGQAPFKIPRYATQPCIDFIAACLSKDKSKRPRAADALQRSWMASSSPKTRCPQSRNSQVARTPSNSSVRLLCGAVAGGLYTLMSGCCDGVIFCLDMILGDEQPATGV